ncbi:MAG: ribonuclease HII [Spirochaetaceae bacterium]|jgi:ribonuclease HII|nr:ribonuclease HII [Spirochaetaceae bacterium]
MAEFFCGLDEAGRGPLAGPVYAAAVLLDDDFPCASLNDSKKLGETARRKAAALIREKAAAWGVGWASHTEIDEINILKASLLAMSRAFSSMSAKLAWNTENLSDFIEHYASKVRSTVVDGLHVPQLPVPCEARPHADAENPAVMAASIIAKTERDAEMRRLAVLYPGYRYEKHKGYPTKEHYALIAELGPSPIQRLSFRYR